MTELTTDRPTEISGLEQLRAIADGTLPPPPMALLMGMDLIEAEPGRALFAAVPTTHHSNGLRPLTPSPGGSDYPPATGSVHGGFTATLLDSAMGCAVQTHMPAGVGYTTLELSINLVRAITADTGRVLCEGRTIHVGRRTATAEARLTEEATGKLLAHGTTTCLVTPLGA